METNIYLIRHSKKNYGVVHFGEMEKGWDHDFIPLSIEGEELAIKLASSEALGNIDVIYSSATLRTINTIKYYAELKNLKIYLTNDIIERRFGDLKTLPEGVTINDMQLKDYDFKCPQGESFRDVEKRMVERVNKVLEKHDGKNIIFSTHNTAMKVILNYYDGSFRENNKDIKITNPGVYKMTFKNGKFYKYKHLEL